MTDFFAGLPQPLRSVLVQEAVRLLAALPDGPSKAITEQLRPQFLRDKAKSGSAPLRKGTHPIGTMLYERPSFQLPQARERDWLRGWALAGALRFCHTFRETDRHSRMTAGLRAARRITQSRYGHDIFLELPTFDGGLHSLIGALRHLNKALDQRGIELNAQLNHLELLLMDADRPVAPRHVDPFRRGTDDHPMLIPRAEVARGSIIVTLIGDSEMRADSAPEDQTEELRPAYYDFGSTLRNLPHLSREPKRSWNCSIWMHPTRPGRRILLP